MNLTLRLIVTCLRALLAPRSDPLAVHRLTGGVWLTDIDWNWHMTNARYLSAMDLGRVDLLIRAGIYRAMRKRGWITVISALKIRYRRALAPLARYRQETRVLCWDGEGVYIEQRLIEAGGVVAALAVMRNVFRDQQGKPVDLSGLMAELGVTGPSPPMPAHIAKFLESEEELRRVTASDHSAPAKAG